MMEDFESETGSEYTSYWRDWFLGTRGNEYFCEIDDEYITDRFNLTGLNAEVQHYQYALDMVTDMFDLECEDALREQIEKSARQLYGLVHARYITTGRGLQKMFEKFKKGDFGKCPRVFCQSPHLVPCGLSDQPGVQFVKLYCAKCEDIYNPKSNRHATIDGAFFGTSFAHMLFQMWPNWLPEKTSMRYQPKVFGFRTHASATLHRWQNAKKEAMLAGLYDVGIANPFANEQEDDDEDSEEISSEMAVETDDL